MHLLIDSINQEGTFGITTSPDKIYHNLGMVPKLLQKSIELKKTNEAAFSTMTIMGRWIIVYSANVSNDDDDVMHFIDFNIDMKSENIDEIFFENTLNQISALQMLMHQCFNKRNDTVDLTHAEPDEEVLKPNLFICGIPDTVLKKAKSLGVLPLSASLKGRKKGKYAIREEVLTIDSTNITNVYAIISFEGNDDKVGNGLMYLKIFDLFHNLDRINDLKIGIEDAGGEFDTNIFMELINRAKLN